MPGEAVRHPENDGVEASTGGNETARAEPRVRSFVCPGVKILLWLLLLVVCWPVALLALVLYPIVWILLLPFRVLGIAVEGVLAFLRALFFLPARVLGGARR